MRCYHLCNMYLSSIQQGIQSAHAQMELFNKYVPANHNRGSENCTPDKYNQAFDWSINHKTMIVLNGGYLKTMENALELLTQYDNPYPFAPFYESKEALGGILTNIAIVLPEKIYSTIPCIRFLPEGIVDFSDAPYGEYHFTGFEKELMVLLKGFKLAS